MVTGERPFARNIYILVFLPTVFTPFPSPAFPQQDVRPCPYPCSPTAKPFCPTLFHSFCTSHEIHPQDNSHPSWYRISSTCPSSSITHSLLTSFVTLKGIAVTYQSWNPVRADESSNARAPGVSTVQPSGQKLVSFEEVQKHNKRDDCWVIIDVRGQSDLKIYCKVS